MGKPAYKFIMEMPHDMRAIEADSFVQHENWLIFYRKPPQGGNIEHWRVQLDRVASMETRRND